MFGWKFISIIFLLSISSIGNCVKKRASIVTKDVIHFCDPSIPNSCGVKGRCVKKNSGNRCECPDGFMGVKCKRPCQDIYKSCVNWLEEKRCVWARPISPFFADNCPLSCGKCQNSGGKKLPLPLPPILEDISWIIGRWEKLNGNDDFNGYRFPRKMTGGYSEVLDIMITEVPSFDRPGLNVSVTAKSTNPSTSDIVNKELGFITIKPFLEDTGFAEFDKPKSGPDLVALELSSNTGMLTIEEGVMKKTFNRTLNAHVNMIVMDLKYENDYLNKDGEIKDSKRVFKHISKVLSNGELQEKLLEITAIEKRSGEILRFKKVYKKIFDYLKNY